MLGLTGKDFRGLFVRAAVPFEHEFTLNRGSARRRGVEGPSIDIWHGGIRHRTQAKGQGFTIPRDEATRKAGEAFIIARLALDRNPPPRAFTEVFPKPLVFGGRADGWVLGDGPGSPIAQGTLGQRAVGATGHRDGLV